MSRTVSDYRTIHLARILPVEVTAARTVWKNPTSSRMSRASSLAAVFHGPGSEACTTCHSFHDPLLIRAGAKQFRYAFGEPALRAQCASCHTDGGSLAKVTDGHRDAARSFGARARSAPAPGSGRTGA